MKDKSTTFGLSLKKVVELLNIGTDVSSTAADEDQQKADLLSDRLSETLPPHCLADDEPSKNLERFSRTIGILSGEPIGKLLRDPQADIATIKMTKDHGRRLSTHAKSEADEHAANTIYYAAIAHALIYNDLRITKHPYEELQQSFCLLSKEDWIPRDLLELFAKAAEYCRIRKG